MKMIANQTIHGQRFHPKDEKRVNSKERYETIVVAPGEEFDTAVLDIGDVEAKALVGAGVARERGKLDEGPVNEQPAEDNTDDLGSASGQTKAPDPNAVAGKAKS